RDSAFERLKARAEAAAKEAAAAEAAEAKAAQDAKEFQIDEREFNSARRYDGNRDAPRTTKKRSSSDSIGEAFAKSFARQLGTKSGQAIVRGILGSLFKSR
ncbi:MAG: helicase HerA-like domain-containing protein, partial [Pseudorhodobacter sp.]